MPDWSMHCIFLTWGQLMQLYEALNIFFEAMKGIRSPATILFYRNTLTCLGEYFGNCDLRTINIDQLRAWRSTLVDRSNLWGGGSSHPEQPGHLSTYTIHKFVRAARRFFRWLCLENLLEIDPAKRLELPELPQRIARGISSKKKSRLLDAASSPRDVAIIMFLSDTACRRGGLAGLRLSDLHLKRREILAREKGRGGQHKERQLYFKRKTARAIRAWLKVRPARLGDSLFGLSPDGIYRVLQRLASKAKVVDGWNPHSFRHATIRKWLAAGMPLPQASQLAGHSSIVVTGDIYGRFNERDLRKAYRKYS